MAKKKYWNKLIYRYTIKILLSILTFRFFRKKISRIYRCKKLALQVDNLLNEKSIVIIQHTFFDRDGLHCFNGGAERYVQDLASIIKNSGNIPILLQIGHRIFGAIKLEICK